MDESAQVGRRLRKAREQQGLSLREIARRLGISASALSQIETGKSRPSVKTLYAIVSELGLSMDELFAEPGAQRAETQNAPLAAVPTVQQANGHSSLQLLSGELELTIGGETHLLAPGDSCSFDPNEPHRLANSGTEPAAAIWFVAGRQSG